MAVHLLEIRSIFILATNGTLVEAEEEGLLLTIQWNTIETGLYILLLDYQVLW
jgi:hypothetical protein